MFLGTLFEYMAQGFVLAVVCTLLTDKHYVKADCLTSCRDTTHSGSKGKPALLNRSLWLSLAHLECM